MPLTIALVFAGGSGVRMGASIPKQFLPICGKPVLAHTLELFQAHPEIDGIWVVVSADNFGRVDEILREHKIAKFRGMTAGGASAQESIYNGLKAMSKVAPADTIVLLHDGVRPYVTHEVISANIAGVKANGNAVTYTPCFETLVLSEDGQHISDIPPRRISYAAQAPQSFRLGDIMVAHERIRARPGGYTDMVDQATICWNLGMPINLVPGNRGNIKITTPEDLVILESLIRRRAEIGEREIFCGKRVMITGATGLIGSALCRVLVTKGAQVVAFVRSLEKARQALPPEVEVVEGDVSRKVSYEGELDCVIHAAGPTASKFFVEHPEDTRRIIVEGTRNALELAKAKRARMVYISSMEVYGECGHVDVGEDDLGWIAPDLPRNSYPLAKRVAEELCLQYAKSGVETVIVRPVQTFGTGVPQTDCRVFMQFARAKVSGKDIILKTDGSKAHCYCATEDCVAGILTALSKGTSGEVYNISNEENFYSIREMAEMLVGKDRVRIELAPENYPPNTRMRVLSRKLRALGWKPKISLREMYDQVIADLLRDKNERN